LVWGWNILKGSDQEYFVIQQRENGTDKSFRQGWRESLFDPGIGTTREGRATIKAFLWSRQWFLDKLLFLFVRGAGPLWEIPKDTPSDYFTEMLSSTWNEEESRFDSTGPDHGLDCELMSCVVADIGGITRTLPAPAPEN
jgi:hypothetical protein